MRALLFLLTVVGCALLAGCERPDPITGEMPQDGGLVPTAAEFAAPGREGAPPVYEGQPTPDAPHPVAPQTTQMQTHVVSAGETLAYVAQLYGRSLTELLQANSMSQADFLYVGQELVIPGGTTVTGSSFKIIPDSELVYGPAAARFDVRTFARQYNGFLMAYMQTVEGQTLPGPEIVTLVANRYSVNPRLLLAALEHRSGWVTQSIVGDTAYSLGYQNGNATGLYEQLGWAANQINWGYYGRSEGNVLSFVISDGTSIAYPADINHGTAGVQRLLAAASDATFASWQQAVGRDGFFATYTRLFGNPFAYTVEPLLPTNLVQPPLRLPWAADEVWAFTGGPHGGWAAGSAWAALDFAPPSTQLGCYESDYWVRSMTDGIVTRSSFGAVVVDLDGDGFAGTGWAITYMHLATRDRIPIGTAVQAGDPLGHPSCEGGFSNGTHVHVARTYNGRWIAADGNMPFELGGWVSQGYGREYDGLLVRNGESREACACRIEENAIPGN